ncbi:MAG: hypothetical protein R3F11_17935 [Verrucomicrobiales bacterium]
MFGLKRRGEYRFLEICEISCSLMGVEFHLRMSSRFPRFFVHLLVRFFTRLEGASRLAWHPDLPQLLVFGSDHFGGHFCISVGAAKGAIFWVDHEETNPDCLSVRIVSRFQFLPPDLARGVTKLADSLSEFLQMLHHSTDDYIVHLLRHDDAGFRISFAPMG